MDKQNRLSVQSVLDALSHSHHATAIYTTSDLIIEFANEAMLGFWGKDKQIIGMRLEDAVPEYKEQLFLDRILEVWHTGITDSGKAIAAHLIIHDELQTFYYDYEYKGIKNAEGEVYCILHSATEVTEQVKFRKGQQWAEENLQMAIDSAGMGTWSTNLLTDELVISDRSADAHGITDQTGLTLNKALDMILPEYRDQVTDAISYAIDSGNTFDVEYMIQPLDGSAKKWIKATGKGYYDHANKPLSISGTLFDITERKEAEQRKDDFLSIASHELKTPVTSLKASIQLLKKTQNESFGEKQQRLINNAHESIEKINVLIEDLLNVSRMNQGQLQLNKTIFSLAPILNNCCTHVRDEGEFELITSCNEQMNVYADEHQIGQVLVNLVNNAVKYAAESKQIYINGSLQDQMVRIAVRDRGPGIPAEQLKHLFDRYYRAEHGVFKNAGLGLGLYICAEIVRRHDGEIGVNSVLGEGSEFWFTIPAV